MLGEFEMESVYCSIFTDRTCSLYDFCQMLEDAGFMFFLVDTDWRIILFNKKVGEILGYSPKDKESIVGKSLLELVDEDSVDDFFLLKEYFEKQGKLIKEISLNFQTRDKKTISVKIYNTKIVLKERFIFIVGIPLHESVMNTADFQEFRKNLSDLIIKQNILKLKIGALT